MPLDQNTLDAATVGNLKASAEQPAILSNLVYSNIIANLNLSQQNAVANQQSLNELGIAIIGKMVNVISNLGPLEARSAVDVLSNNELAQTIADLKASLQVFNGGNLGARSAVDVLSNNELAQTIADLKASVQAFKNSLGERSTVSTASNSEIA